MLILLSICFQSSSASPKMSSQIKTEPNVLPNVVPHTLDDLVPRVVPNVVPNVIPRVFHRNVSGTSFFAKIGDVSFKWTIQDFKEFLELGQTIVSPSFQMETTDPLLKVHSYHLEMEIPNKQPRSKCPIFLINETGGEILTKITLNGYSPQHVGVNTHRQCLYLSLDASTVVQKDEKIKVMTVTLPDSEASYYFPKGVTIAITVTLCQPAKQIVSSF
jgi:hypothetical protein